MLFDSFSSLTETDLLKGHKISSKRGLEVESFKVKTYGLIFKSVKVFDILSLIITQPA